MDQRPLFVVPTLGFDSLFVKLQLFVKQPLPYKHFDHVRTAINEYLEDESRNIDVEDVKICVACWITMNSLQTKGIHYWYLENFFADEYDQTHDSDSEEASTKMRQKKTLIRDENMTAAVQHAREEYAEVLKPGLFILPDSDFRGTMGVSNVALRGMLRLPATEVPLDLCERSVVRTDGYAVVYVTQKDGQAPVPMHIVQSVLDREPISLEELQKYRLQMKHVDSQSNCHADGTTL